jgi:hypothetical protein
MPFCSSCGAEIASGKKFCSQCGAPVEPVPVPVVPFTPTEQKSPADQFPVFRLTRKKPKISKNTFILWSIGAIVLIMAAVYFIGLPLLKTGGQKTMEEIMPSPSVTPIPYQTVLPTPTPQYTTAIPETTTPPVLIRDARLEENYEQIYTLHQNFSFGQKVNYSHDLTRPPLYIRFNLTPTMIIHHRLVSAMTNNEHYENATETSPYAWFEIKVLDAKTGAVVEQEGFGNDYSDITQQSFMVRQKGNYQIVMSGNEVLADVQMLTGTAH